MEDLDAILSFLPLRLKKARRAKGLSLDAVAKLSGVSRSMVSQIERGESSPTISTLWNLTKALQVDFAGLLEDDQESRVEILRSNDVPTIENHGTGCSIRILSPPKVPDGMKSMSCDLAQAGRWTACRTRKEHANI